MPVEVGLLDKLAVDVDLVAAILPEDFKSRPVEVNGQKLSLPLAAAPVLADINRDTLLDLLVMDDAGAATVYAGDVDNGYLAGESLLLDSAIAGAVPFVVDWNNDGEKDLLVGGVDSLNLYLGMTGAPLLLQDATTLLGGENTLSPTVADLNGDSQKDLLVGTASGQVYALLNSGEDAAPVFMARQALLKSPLAGAVTPALVDWNADGERQLLVAAQGALYLCAADESGQYVPVQMLTVDNLEVSKAAGKGKVAASGATLALGEKLRFAVSDIDGKSGKDIVVGNSAGELFEVVSHGDLQAVAYREALLEKVAQIEELGVDMTEVKSALTSAKDEQALTRIEALLADVTLSGDTVSMLEELVRLLQ